MTPPRPAPLWAYTYQLKPPQSAARLRSIRTLLDAEHVRARDAAAIWTGRLVADERITHLLVLSDSPELMRPINERIEAELRALDLKFSVTVPLAVPTLGDSASEVEPVD